MLRVEQVSPAKETGKKPRTREKLCTGKKNKGFFDELMKVAAEMNCVAANSEPKQRK